MVSERNSIILIVGTRKILFVYNVIYKYILFYTNIYISKALHLCNDGRARYVQRN